MTWKIAIMTMMTFTMMMMIILFIAFLALTMMIMMMVTSCCNLSYYKELGKASRCIISSIDNHISKLEHVKLITGAFQCHINRSCPLLTHNTSTFQVNIGHFDTQIVNSQLKEKSI